MRELTNRELPSGWLATTLGEFFSWTSGGTPPTGTASFYGGNIPWLTSGELNDASITSCERTITESGLKNSSAKWVQPGSVLIALYGATIGKLGIADIPLTTNQAIAFTNPAPIPSKFLLYYLMSQRSAFTGLGQGAAQKNISQTILRAHPFVVPPLKEQHRIVEEIDRQFSLLDTGIVALRMAQAKLKRYRASVLQAACTGQLVPTQAELARAEGKEYERADTMLRPIIDQRRSRWKADPNPTNLPALPEGWCWATWDQLAERVTVGYVGPMKHEYVEHGIPFLRSLNVRPNRYDPIGLCFISSEFHARISKSRLRGGDLVVVRSGSVGVTCVVPETLPDANCSDLVVIQRPLGVLSRYGSYWMNSLARREVRAGQVGIALTHFNTQSVAALAVAVPPLAEQHRIVAEVDRRLSVLDEMESTIAANLKRAERLRHAILKKAFEGRLVPQDPNDEPASVLLEHIRAERTAAEIRRPATRARKNNSASKAVQPHFSLGDEMATL